MLNSLNYNKLGKMIEIAKEEKLSGQDIGISIIVTTHNQQEELRRNLPQFFNQEYEGEFEVIVADMASKDDTKHYLEKMQENHSNLHVCLMPTTARDISLHRMAITLAMRASTHDWVIITQADCCPASSKWLSHMTSRCTSKEGVDMVIGLTKYSHAKHWNGLRRRFYRIFYQMLGFTWANNHRAYLAESTNLGYRKSTFFNHKGFADHSNLIAGATEIMVNRQSTKDNTALALNPESFMLQECPRESRLWEQERLFYMETRHHFTQWFVYRLHSFMIVVINSLFTITLFGVVVTESILQKWILVGIIIALWIAYLIFRSIQWHKTIKALDEHSMHISLPVLLNMVPIWHIDSWLNWLFTKKKTFRKKFV